jgi:hypothetical protein
MSKEKHFVLSEEERSSFLRLGESFGESDVLYGKTNQMARNLLSPVVEKILPADIVAAIFEMKDGVGPELMTISNLPFDEDLPSDEALDVRVLQKTKISETCLVGINSLLGGEMQEERSSHQPGCIHQVTPVEKFVGEASGRGGGGIPFHAENMFVKNSPTFLSLFCIKGEVGVETEYLYVSDIVKRLDEETINALKKPIYTISSGDGFDQKVLSNSPVLDDLGSGWIACRFYEEDRIFSEGLEGKGAIEMLHAAINAARDEDTKSVELTSGTLLLFSNAIRKGACGGVLHGRRGDMSIKKTASSNASNNRWLQRVCVELSY